MAIRLLLVDALNLIRRVYAAQPGDDDPERAERATGASVQSLQRALRECEPTHALAVFEQPGRSWRHQLLASYKAGHQPMPEPLRAALPGFREGFLEVGVRSFAMPDVEADDVIATLAVKTQSESRSVVILSTDKIFLQLLSDRIAVRDHFNKGWLDRSYVRRRFGVEPERFVDFLALAGDATNDIRGVPGVGPKTAARLLEAHGSLDAILQALAKGESSTTPKLLAKLRPHVEEAQLARSLARLETGLELGLHLRSMRFPADSSR